MRTHAYSVVLLAALLVFAIFASPTFAATFTVTNLNDSGAGSLRAAIVAANANPGSTIVFQSGLSWKISLASSLPIISTGMTITASPVNAPVIDGSGRYRAFQINTPGSAVSISNFFVNGCSDSVDGAGGAGVLVYAGKVTMTDCVFGDDNSSGNGGCIENNASFDLVECGISNCQTNGNGGAVNNSYGNLSVSNCAFFGNQAEGRLGGGIASSGTVTIADSTINFNRAGTPTLSGGGGGLYSQGPMSLSKCTVDDNSSSGEGGGIYNISAQMALTNCTIVSNSAGSSSHGCGILAGSGGTLNVTNCTIYGNGPGVGSIVNGGSAVLSNCILYADSGGELINNGASATATHCDIEGGYGGSGNISSDPLLASNLANNGGPTETIALQTGSPCFGAGIATGAPPLDQRGATRPKPLSVGAYDDGFFLTIHRFDFNSDGDDDLLFENSNGATLVWDIGGIVVKSYGSVFTTVAPPWHIQAVGDINADGHPDLLWWNSLTGQCLFWEMTGTLGTTVLQYEPSFASVTDTHWHPVSMADLDGDGHP